MSQQRIDPNSLEVEDAARILSLKYKQSITIASLKQLLAEGAPQNDDGTLNIVHLTAWLVRERFLGN